MATALVGAALRGEMKSSPVEIAKYVRMRSEMAKAANGPIEFHAVVRGPGDKPLSGVQVDLSVTSNSENISDYLGKPGKPVRTEKVGLMTDAAGRIHLAGRTGTWLRVENISKAGFEWNHPKEGSLEYERQRVPKLRPYQHFATPNLYTMRDVSAAAPPLLSRGFTIRLQEADHSHRINLLAKNPYETNGNADLLISFRFVSPHDPAHQYRQEILIEAVDGGIVESLDVTNITAPTAGYEKQWRTLFEFKSPEYRAKKFTLWFFIKARGGKVSGLAEVRMSFASYGFEMDTILSPTGSLELRPFSLGDASSEEDFQKWDAVTKR